MLILLKLLKLVHLFVRVLLVGLTEQQGYLGTTRDSARNLCDLWLAQVDQWAYFLWIIDLTPRFAQIHQLFLKILTILLLGQRGAQSEYIRVFLIESSKFSCLHSRLSIFQEEHSGGTNVHIWMLTCD